MRNQVAETILNQLGGQRFAVMTGAYNLTGDTDCLIFKIPKALRGITAVRIALTPADTYTVTFYKVRGTSVTVVSEYKDVDVGLFEEETGLYLSL